MSDIPNARTNATAVGKFTKTEHRDTYPYIAPSKTDGSGRSVLITGSSRGIGKATALSYAAAGFSKIAITGRSDMSSVETEVKQAASNAGRTRIPKVISINLDVSSEDSVKAAADTVTKEFGGALDVLVNNAGYLAEFTPLDKSDPAEWWKTWDVNIKGTMLCSKYFLPLLLQSELKTNILTSSNGGLMTSTGAEAYQTTKFAVCRLAEIWNIDFGDQGLVCFAIHPGSVATPLAKNMPVEFHAILNDTLELSGDTIAWLGKERRPWLGGRFISVRWDMEELEARKEEMVERDLLKFRMVV